MRSEEVARLLLDSSSAAPLTSRSLSFARRPGMACLMLVHAAGSCSSASCSVLVDFQFVIAFHLSSFLLI